VVAAGIEKTAPRKGKDLAAHRAEQAPRVALLEIGAAAAAEQERVAGEGHRAVVGHVGQAAAGVAGRGARLERAPAEGHRIARLEVAVGALRAARRAERDAAAELLL